MNFKLRDATKCFAPCFRIYCIGTAFLGLVVAKGSAAEPATTSRPHAIRVLAIEPSTEALPQRRAGVDAARLALAARGIDVEVTWRTSTKPGDRPEQARLIDAAGEFDGLLLWPIDRRLIGAAVASLAARDVPIVAVDAPVVFHSAARTDYKPTMSPTAAIDLPIASRGADAALPQVGCDNRAVGRAAARELCRLIGGRGNVLFMRFQIQSGQTEEREEGFLEVLANEYRNVHLVASDFHTGPTSDSAARIGKGLLERHSPMLDGLFASSEPTTLGAIRAVRAAKLGARKIHVVGIQESAAADDAANAGELGASLARGEVDSVVRLDSAAAAREALVQLADLVDEKRGGGAVEQTPAKTAIALVSRAGVQRDVAGEPRSDLSGRRDPPKQPIAPLSESLVIPDLNVELVHVPAGEVILRTRTSDEKQDDGSSQTRVKLSAFWLGRF